MNIHIYRTLPTTHLSIYTDPYRKNINLRRMRSVKKVVHPYINDWTVMLENNDIWYSVDKLSLLYDNMDTSMFTRIYGNTLNNLQSRDLQAFWDLSNIENINGWVEISDKQLDYIRKHTNIDSKQLRLFTRSC